MQEISIKWNIINYDLNSSELDLYDLLKQRFLDNELEKWLQDLYDPYLLADMKKAVDRIVFAQKNNQRVVIFGDYDVDWVTSTSILVHFLKKIWVQVSYRLPHRVNDWYWMKSYFMDELASLWVDLVITVDCWTRDIDVIKHAKSLWIDVIITDHHAVPEVIPDEAIAVINPKRTDCPYPFKHLSWAWVALKLMMALAREYFDEKEYNKYLFETIDIAAIWTVADCMPIIWENRIIVSAWLKRLKDSRSVWIRKLVQDKINDDLDADVFGFLIWPRINAAWRLDTPYKALNLILNNWDKIDEIIYDIENINNRRKDLTKAFFEDALSKIDSNNNIIFYDSKEIEHWIIWIVAWRITELHHKPSIVLKDEGEKLVASCRSPEYFSIIEILERYKPYFLHFWWHKQAAWFSISKEKYEEFKQKITSEINLIDFAEHKKVINIDKVIDITDFWFNLFNIMNQFKPFWIWNPKPIFMFKDFEYDKVEFLWSTQEHITIKNNYWIKIIWFNIWEYFYKLKWLTKASFIFEISWDEWMGKRTLSCRIIDIII